VKVLHLSHADISGGAARATYRIHSALLQAKVDSKMQVWSKTSGDPNIQGNSSKIGRMLAEIRSGAGLLANITLQTSNPARHSINLLPSTWVQSLNASDADVIHLHWIGAETLSIHEIAQIRKPIVWTFHDMWAFCGAEHYTDDSPNARWRDGYQSNNRDVNESGLDLNRWTWERKRRCWQNPFQIVCPSNWLADCVQQSKLMHNWQVSVITTPLDLETFRPIEKKLARKLLNLPESKTLILFGAIGGSNDSRKGSDLLLEALSFLKAEQFEDMELVIFGQLCPIQAIDLGFPIRYMGYLHDDISLALLYSAVDVFVAPSRQDNLPNTVAEAIACGTPTAAFQIGGMPDLIMHQVSGYLAQPYDTQELAKGIQWIIEQQKQDNSLGIAAREYAKLKLNPSDVAQKYLEIYKRC
jgi:glycosyltransferase involved in cell wall biosynthesis